MNGYMSKIKLLVIMLLLSVVLGMSSAMAKVVIHEVQVDVYKEFLVIYGTDFGEVYNDN